MKLFKYTLGPYLIFIMGIWIVLDPSVLVFDRSESMACGIVMIILGSLCALADWMLLKDGK